MRTSENHDAVRALTILAVDDDALVLMCTCAMIEEMGHTPLEAASGAAALALLRSGATVDLVITDHAMPGMTGAEFAQSAHREWPQLPIILATGYSELPDEAPPLPTIGKPFTEKHLAAKIAEVLSST